MFVTARTSPSEGWKLRGPSMESPTGGSISSGPPIAALRREDGSAGAESNIPRDRAPASAAEASGADIAADWAPKDFSAAAAVGAAAAGTAAAGTAAAETAEAGRAAASGAADKAGADSDGAPASGAADRADGAESDGAIIGAAIVPEIPATGAIAGATRTTVWAMDAAGSDAAATSTRNERLNRIMFSFTPF